MDLSLLWCVTDLISKLCEVTTWLEDDPNYTKSDAAKDLLKIIEYIDETLYSKAIHPAKEQTP